MTKSTQPQPDKQLEWQHTLVESATRGTKDHDYIRKLVWKNPTNSTSLRLTQVGYEWVTKICNQKTYEFKIEKGMNNKVLLQLDRLMTAPYYIHNRAKIHMLSESDSIMLSLNGSDLESYLDNLQS